MNFILPIILLVASLGLTFGFTKPTYSQIKDLKGEHAQYSDAVKKFDELIQKRDELTKKKDFFSPADLNKLDRILPDNVNNIGLIIEIQDIANRYAFQLEDVRFDVPTKKASGTTPSSPQQALASQKPYETFNFDFTVTGTYQNFIKFISDLESSSRLIDITSIQFSTRDGSSAFRYSVKAQTYWLKSI
jgi:Tfp pilus assembly protein PilO